MPDISDSLYKYAQLAIAEKYVDFDPKNPQDTNKTPLGNEKFLSRQKSIIDSDRNRQIAYGQLHDKVLSLIRNPSELARPQQLFTNSDYDEWLLAKAGTIVWPFSVLKSVLFNDGLPGQI